MKSNIVKYIFIIVVIILIISAVCIFFHNQKNKENNNVEITNGEQVEYSNELNLAIFNYDSINPLISKNKDVINIGKLIFEPLIDIDENYKIKMCLAKECAKISDTCYLIKLNEGIKWQDGKEFSAKDVKFTIEQIKKGNSIYSAQVEPIENVEIIDNLTIKINLNKKVNFFEYNLTFPILSSHIYEDENLAVSSKNPLGTGCFKIKTMDSNAINLEKNEYWSKKNENASKIETIKILLYDGMEEEYSNFKIGNIDFIHTNSTEYQDYLGNIGYNIKEYKGRELDFISFNCKDSRLIEKEVRKAISFAIDKTKIISDVYNNQYYISDFPLDFGSYVYNKENVSLGYNAEQVKKVLKDAGWNYQNNKWQKINSKGKIITLSFNLIVQSSQESRIKVAEAIKEQLEEIGIIVNIKKVTDSQYINCLQNKNYEIILTGISNGFSPDLEYFYGNDNIAQYENEEVFEIIEETKNITDTNVLVEKYNKLSQIVQTDSPYICLYRNKEIILLNSKVGGEIVPNNYNIFNKFWTWCVTIHG